MSDLVTVPFGDNRADKAVLLLAGAEAKGLDPSVVRTDTGGAEPVFIVPREVADAAGVDGVEDHDDPFDTDLSGSVVDMDAAAKAEAEIKRADQQEQEAPAKKTAAKRTPAKKTAAKKAPAKKAAAKKASE